MSFFTFHRVAAGYAAHRPYFHPLVMQKIRDQLALAEAVPRALDVGCGSGLSTHALRALADRVTGTDNAAEMIAVAQAQCSGAGISYSQATAEQMPFASGTFDLITVGGAINWIDRTQFLPAARRILKPGSWLIIYDNFITDQARDCPAYTTWYNEQFLTRYPKPPRDESPFTSEDAHAYGFRLMHSEIYTNDVRWTLDEYVNYLLTQSNIIVPVDQGDESPTTARDWLRATLAPMLPPTTPTAFVFDGYVWVIQRA